MRELYVLIIAVCFVQLCTGAAVFGEKSFPTDSSEGLTDEDINNFRKVINTAAGVKNETLETLQGVLNKFKIGTTSAEKREGASSEEDTENDSSVKEWTVEELSKFEKELKTKLSVEETEEIMKILRKFREGSTPEERKQAEMDVVLYGINGAVERFLLL
ncbi:hypothetical protein Bhyg_06021 [Pseudolycoriella hygida]|uniref:Uncharacterized protein n=1 Tax=Pseudolycoriella hygida TaxID=35572 RepID=A0A9Q0N0P3_9DIPT|nr:hypothetical protein Bhyg_06021 [Pseudolycoriella hygida]